MFLDAERRRHVAGWPDLPRLTCPERLMAVDRATNPWPFGPWGTKTLSCLSVLVPAGHGGGFIAKTPDPEAFPRW
jgi:hypothetical protein